MSLLQFITPEAMAESIASMSASTARSGADSRRLAEANGWEWQRSYPESIDVFLALPDVTRVDVLAIAGRLASEYMLARTKGGTKGASFKNWTTVALEPALLEVLGEKTWSDTKLAQGRH